MNIIIVFAIKLLLAIVPSHVDTECTQDVSMHMVGGTDEEAIIVRF